MATPVDVLFVATGGWAGASILQYPGQPPITENDLTENSSNTKVEKHYPKSITVLGISDITNKYLLTLTGKSLPAYGKQKIRCMNSQCPFF